MDQQTFRLSVRTTLAALLSLVAAGVCRLPEVYWAVVTSIVVMQSTLGAAWDVSCQRLIGTFIGGLTGAGLEYVSGSAPTLVVFAGGMLLMGLACAVLRLQISAYRFAGVTLAIVMLPERVSASWVVALHRFLEVVFGIVVAMGVMAIWPEPEQPRVEKPLDEGVPDVAPSNLTK